MNAFVTALYRAATCASAAALITVVLGLAFVQSTAMAPGVHASTGHIVALSSEHAWFGQPQPAVLVD